ncbi:hypothetical protein CcCBS67573_g05747 [Chytriomyces confervae]|uniref:TIR domain-containing protein n=1 Tax=Chytriomyces confervae TaxID=246404 RepID=A0A507FAF9_9FUNG|nr:hypothetical protein CcCBS67573_g05747 [Chytriomyces confervae]
MISVLEKDSEMDKDEETPLKKQFHIFISYRVNTDADLAEKLADKLQQLPILNEQRQVNIRCFLDKQNLKEGVEYTQQFLDGLHGSCLFLPLISEACLESMTKIQDGWNDNVVREWQTALTLQQKNQLVIMPLLIGATVDRMYKRFDGFSLCSQLPQIQITDAPSELTVRAVASQLFVLQGVFVNPSEVGDKLSVIQTRFSNEVWPRFRADWENTAELGPEPRYSCVQCYSNYSASENGDGACSFHLSDGPLQKFSSKYRCCGSADPKLGCTRGRHRSEHHNEYTYGAFFNWRNDLVQFVDMTKTIATVAADDYKEDSVADKTVSVSIGAVLARASTRDRDKVYINMYGGEKRFFQVFGAVELKAVNADKPIAELVGLRGEYIRADWLANEQKEIIGAKLQCKTKTSLEPNSVTVLFAWPEVPDFNGPVPTSIEYSKAIQFGEKPLPENLLADKQNPYNFPKALYSGQPVPNFVVRPRDENLPRWASPKCPLKVKINTATARFDAYRKSDYLTVELTILNTSKEPLTVVESRSFARLRTTQDAALVVPDVGDDSDLILTAEWKPVKSHHVAQGRAGTLPVTVEGSGVLHLTCNAWLPTDKYVDDDVNLDNRNSSWIACRSRCPVLLDVEFEDIFGETFGGMAEFPLPDLRLGKEEKVMDFVLHSDDAVTLERQLIKVYVEKEIPYSADYEDPLYVRDHSLKFFFRTSGTVSMGVSTFRYIVIMAEENRAKDDDSKNVFGLFDMTNFCLSNKRPPYENFNSTPFQIYAHAIIDFDRRCVVAIRFSSTTRSMKSVGYYVVPPYGDALGDSSTAADMTAIPVLDATDAIAASWLKEEAEMSPTLKDSAPIVSEKLPVQVRAQFSSGNEHATSGGGAVTAAQIDPIALEKIIGPIVAREMAAAIPILTREISASFQSGIDRLLARIEELEDERKALAKYLGLKESQSKE